MSRQLFDLPPIALSDLTEEEAASVDREFDTKFTFNDGLEGFIGYPVWSENGHIPHQPTARVRIKILKNAIYPNVDFMQQVGPGCLTPREEAILQLAPRIESTFNPGGSTAIEAPVNG